MFQNQNTLTALAVKASHGPAGMLASMNRSHQKLTMVVKDQGQGIYTKPLEKRNAGGSLVKLQPGGRGIPMMRMMNEFAFADQQELVTAAKATVGLIHAIGAYLFVENFDSKAVDFAAKLITSGM